MPKPERKCRCRQQTAERQMQQRNNKQRLFNTVLGERGVFYSARPLSFSKRPWKCPGAGDPEGWAMSRYLADSPRASLTSPEHNGPSEWILRRGTLTQPPPPSLVENMWSSTNDIATRSFVSNWLHRIDLVAHQRCLSVVPASAYFKLSRR